MHTPLSLQINYPDFQAPWNFLQKDLEKVKKLLDIFIQASMIPPRCLTEKLDFSGGLSEEETPVPIPNTAVKLLRADGTALETVWESRAPPGNFCETPLQSGVFCVWGLN